MGDKSILLEYMTSKRAPPPLDSTVNEKDFFSIAKIIAQFLLKAAKTNDAALVRTIAQDLRGKAIREYVALAYNEHEAFLGITKVLFQFLTVNPNKETLPKTLSISDVDFNLLYEHISELQDHCYINKVFDNGVDADPELIRDRYRSEVKYYDHNVMSYLYMGKPVRTIEKVTSSPIADEYKDRLTLIVSAANNTNYSLYSLTDPNMGLSAKDYGQDACLAKYLRAALEHKRYNNNDYTFLDFKALIKEHKQSSLLRSEPHEQFLSKINSITNLAQLLEMYKQSCFNLHTLAPVSEFNWQAKGSSDQLDLLNILETFNYVQEDFLVRRAFFERSNKLFDVLARRYDDVVKRVEPDLVIRSFLSMLRHQHFKDRYYFPGSDKSFTNDDTMSVSCVADKSLTGVANFILTYLEREHKSDPANKLIKELAMWLPAPMMTYIAASKNLSDNQILSLVEGFNSDDSIHINQKIKRDLTPQLAEFFAAVQWHYPLLTREDGTLSSQFYLDNNVLKSRLVEMEKMIDEYCAIWKSDIVKNAINNAQKSQSDIPDMSFLKGRAF